MCASYVPPPTLTRLSTSPFSDWPAPAPPRELEYAFIVPRLEGASPGPGGPEQLGTEGKATHVYAEEAWPKPP